MTPSERIAATLARSDFISTRRGIVSTDDLRRCLPAYQVKQNTAWNAATKGDPS